MTMFRNALASAALAATAVAVPAAPPALASSDCPGTVSFVSGSSATSDGSTYLLRATFSTQGPGFIPQQCDLGWVTTCELYVDGSSVPADCPTGYAPEPDRCPSATPCNVYVSGTVQLSPGTHSVRAVLGMTWGCCNYQGGPPAEDEGSWTVTVTGTGGDDCQPIPGDVCRKIDPRVKVLLDDLLP
jgi:hypothetical protein